MFDIPGRATAASTKLSPEFYTARFAALATGEISIAVTATSVDDEEAGLIDQELVDGRVPTLDEAFALIRQTVRFA